MTSAIDDSSKRIVIAGAGPHGLATALHLAAPRLRSRLVVVDPTGSG